MQAHQPPNPVLDVTRATDSKTGALDHHATCGPFYIAWRPLRKLKPDKPSHPDAVPPSPLINHSSRAATTTAAPRKLAVATVAAAVVTKAAVQAEVAAMIAQVRRRHGVGLCYLQPARPHAPAATSANHMLSPCADGGDGALRPADHKTDGRNGCAAEGAGGSSGRGSGASAGIGAAGICDSVQLPYTAGSEGMEDADVPAATLQQLWLHADHPKTHPCRQHSPVHTAALLADGVSLPPVKRTRSQ